MGGFCGVYTKEDCAADLFFGTDYHSHLGTYRGGMVLLDHGRLQRSIHNIRNTPFRSKFENEFAKFTGQAGLGVISDTDPQPMIVSSHLGTFAIVTVGILTNLNQLMDEMFNFRRFQFEYSTTAGQVSQTAVVAALINSHDSFENGVKYAQESIKGSCSLMILTQDGRMYAARDRYGRTPIVLGTKEGSIMAVQESCALANLGYRHLRDLGPGEMVQITPEGVTTLIPPGEEMAVCSFLWVYYGYPASTYEGVNVEASRYANGMALAKRSPADADAVGGIPDSGVGHALGFSHESGLPYQRPFVKYTPTWPRSFMPPDQKQRDLIAHMKLIPVPELIKGRKLAFCDDSIVRGTQLREQAARLYNDGVKEIHMRIACPPLVYGCKFLNFSRSKSELDLATRRYILEKEGPNADISKYTDPDGEPYKQMVDKIRKDLGLTTLAFQHLDDLVKAIGLPKCKLCTYCWSGKDVSDKCCGCCGGK